MTTSYKQNTTHEMFVFRVPTELAEQATQVADNLMTSKSAICRQALQQYVNTETGRVFPTNLPTY